MTLHIGLEGAKSKVVSMTRKHGILSDRIIKEKSGLERIQTAYRSVVDELAHTRTTREEHAAKVEQSKRDLGEFQQDYQLATRDLDGKYSRLTVAIQRFYDDLSNDVSKREADYRKLLEQLLTCDDLIRNLEEKEKKFLSEIVESEERFNRAKAEFEDYDKQFQSFKGDIKRFEQELARLDGDD